MPDDSTATTGASPWLFLLGLVIFLGSMVLFVLDLAREIDIFRSVGANAVGAVVLILWAALDTLSDPDSDVSSRSGAAATALLLYGLYLLLAGAVIAGTGVLFHARTNLGLWYLPLAIGAILVGFLLFPTETVVGDEPATDEERAAESEDETENTTEHADEER